jgi:hypothetical protein
MTLVSILRALFRRPRVLRRKTDRVPRLALDSLESREVPAVGGGYTAGGIQGEYFDNPNLTGTPAFVRRDVRIDFDWGFQAPGGSTSPSYARVGPDSFSVRWTGQVIPRFTETYTLKTTSDDGVRLWIRPTGTSDWALMIDHWNIHGAADDSANYPMVAGQSYDIRIEYFDAAGAAVARLKWSSPSTPEEVIDPAMNLGVNAVGYDPFMYADAAKTGRAEWGNVNDYFGQPNAPTDASGYPLSDAGHIFWEGMDPAKTGGVYQLRFQGQAEVSSWMGRATFQANGIAYGSTLPVGAGFDPNTNTTTAQMIVAGTDLLGLNFRHTQRWNGSPENTGISGVQLLRPIAPGSGVDYAPGELFDGNMKNALSRYTTLRYLTANFNDEREWSDRKLPTAMKGTWDDRHAVWENEVMLANETGKDLYITIPINASPDYVYKLANLLKYGSDGVNPYTGPVANPTFPGLNPNLRVYVEWSNEVWNWAFSQGPAGAQAARDAVHNNTPDGQVINFDGQHPDGDFRRWAALKTVQASNTFRQIWGDGAMGDRVRVLLEYQYDNEQNTAIEALSFLNNYFNNADGVWHVPNPHPVSYYIWGAGGASYFSASNPLGLVEDILVPDGGFEQVDVPAGTGQPGTIGTPWAFSGNAGIYRQPPGFNENDRVAVNGVGAVPATGQGDQGLFVSGDGTATITIDFPRAGVYALDFKAAAEFGTDMGNPLDFYFDDQRVTPNGKELLPLDGPWKPGTGYGRDPNQFVTYGTVPVSISGPGRHTFKIVGRGNPFQTTVIDDVRVASTDAIFSSRIPGGGQAAGQVSRLDYQAQLTSQAQYAKAFGLKVVAYEGGWSLGGDTQSVPLQSWAKYRDGRAADVMAAALDAFYGTGGELNVVGTYDQWEADDAINAADYPLVKGIDARNGGLPSAAPFTAAATPAPTVAPPPAAPVVVAAPISAPAPAPVSAPVAAPTTGIPGGWSVDAVGDPDINGGASFDGSRWTVQGAGRNIWGSGDEFEYASSAANGDVVVVARVDSQQRTHGWAKAGVMIRAGTGASAAFVGLFRTPDNGLQFESRSATRAAPETTGLAIGDGPIWVKLVRRANSFAGFYSTDGVRWTRIGDAVTVAMPAAVRAGLAVTSHDATQLSAATFSNVQVVD